MKPGLNFEKTKNNIYGNRCNMTSEQKAFEILKNKGKAHIQLIAKQMGISNEYARLICIGLAKKGLIKRFQDRDCYEIKIKKKVKKEAKKKIYKKPKNNPGKNNPGEERLNLEQIIKRTIDKCTGKCMGQIKKLISLIINKTKGRIKE